MIFCPSLDTVCSRTLVIFCSELLYQTGHDFLDAQFIVSLGPRFKCKTCDNFDFCENCFYNKNSHKHSFNRISEPGNMMLFLLYFMQKKTQFLIFVHIFYIYIYKGQKRMIENRKIEILLRHEIRWKRDGMRNKD